MFDALETHDDVDRRRQRVRQRVVSRNRPRGSRCCCAVASSATSLPRLQVSVVPVTEGDTLVFTTDGVGPEIDDRLLKGTPCKSVAERILARCRNGHDDALALRGAISGSRPMTSISRGATPLNRQTLGDAYVAGARGVPRVPGRERVERRLRVGTQGSARWPRLRSDLVSLHESALEHDAEFLWLESGRPALSRAMAFLLESLSPFEMTYRRFLESNVALRGLNEALENQSRHTARQIHDGAGQILFSLQLALAELMTGLPADGSRSSIR